MNNFREPGIRLLACVAPLLVVGIAAVAQQTASPAQSEDRTRQLWNTQFLEKRPQAAPQAAKTSAPAAASSAQPAARSADAAGDSLVGITIWRLRASQPGDDQAVRISSPASRQQWTPVRFASKLPLEEGERVRVGIEVARSGYLYVVDREQYSDGSLGTPYLIFPTLRINAGNNAVRGGRLVEIPALDDEPPYFTMHKSRPDQKAEMLTVIVTPQPLQELKIGRDPLQLEAAQVARWAQEWGAKVERLDSRATEGTVYTKPEKEAAADRTRLLTHDEPLPQAMYRVDARPGNPILLDVPLQIAR